MVKNTRKGKYSIKILNNSKHDVPEHIKYIPWSIIDRLLRQEWCGEGIFREKTCWTDFLRKRQGQILEKSSMLTLFPEAATAKSPPGLFSTKGAEYRLRWLEPWEAAIKIDHG